MSSPVSLLFVRWFIPSLGTWFALSQMKFLISFVRASWILSGFPCALVRNCVCPPTIAWTIILFLSSVGCTAFHCSRSLCTRSIIGSHGFVSTVSFPTHALRDLIASPSCAIRMFCWIGLSSGCNFRVRVTFSLWVLLTRTGYPGFLCSKDV